jgi:hypothetical protein
MLGDAPLGLDRARRLADRVCWLDRHRRHLAILAAVVLAMLLVMLVDDLLGGEWPQSHATLLAALFGCGVVRDRGRARVADRGVGDGQRPADPRSWSAARASPPKLA